MIRLAVVVALLVAAFSGCASTGVTADGIAADATMVAQDIGVKGTEANPPGLTEAVAAVWKLYGRTDPPPHVLLVTGADLTCKDPSSQNPGFVVLMASGPACREGYTLFPFYVSIAYRGQPWSQSALAHEMEHVRLIRDHQGTPLGDPAHVTAGFQLGGEVDQANGGLAGAGQ